MTSVPSDIRIRSLPPASQCSGTTVRNRILSGDELAVSYRFDSTDDGSLSSHLHLFQDAFETNEHKLDVWYGVSVWFSGKGRIADGMLLLRQSETTTYLLRRIGLERDLRLIHHQIPRSFCDGKNE